MEKNNEYKIPDDEIDFRSLRDKIFSFLAYPFVSFFSNIKTTLFFIALAILLSLCAKYTIPKTYKSSFVIRPSDISDKTYLKVLGDLPLLLKQKDYQALSETLQLDSTSVSKIAGITILNSIFRNQFDSTNCSEIVLETTDYNQFIPVQNAILNYLENNPYFFKIKTLQQQQIDISVKVIDKDIQQLDSLKKLQLTLLSKQNGPLQSSVIMDEIVNPVKAYEMSLQLLTKKTNLLAQQVFLDRFQLIKKCPVTKVHSSPPRVLIMCLYLVPVFLIMCLVFLSVKDRRRSKK